MSNHLAEMWKTVDLCYTKYDQLIFSADFKAGVEDVFNKNFCSSYDLTSMNNKPIYFEIPDKFCVDLSLTNCLEVCKILFQ